MKTHPTPEEWMSYLYGEEPTARHLEHEAHLNVCEQCRTQVEAWRQTMSSLDSWTIPQPRRPVLRRPFLPWAAAAAVLLGLGLALGRFLSPGPAADSRQLQARIQAEVNASLAAARTDLVQLLDQRQAELAQTLRAAAARAASEESQQLLAQYAKLIEEQRDNDRQAYVAALRQLDERRRTDVGALRQQLETVALNADDGLTRAQEQLLQLASSSQPVNR